MFPPIARALYLVAGAPDKWDARERAMRRLETSRPVVALSYVIEVVIDIAAFILLLYVARDLYYRDWQPIDILFPLSFALMAVPFVVPAILFAFTDEWKKLANEWAGRSEQD